MNMQINYIGVLLLLWIVSTAWIVSGYAAKGYQAKNTIRLDDELYSAITHVLNYCYDTEREHYIETFGEESNNYLFIDSDLDLHVEQEDTNHIFVSLHYLQKQLVPGGNNA
jgi:hypothetical protein